MKAEPFPMDSVWFGLQEMKVVVNASLCAQLGEGVCRVAVDIGSPAAKAGARSGDYLLSANGVSLSEFYAKQPAIGTMAVLNVFREGSGSIQFVARLVKRPSKRYFAARSIAQSVQCGGRVIRNDRFKWLAAVSACQRLTPLAKVLAVRLL